MGEREYEMPPPKVDKLELEYRPENSATCHMERHKDRKYRRQIKGYLRKKCERLN